jgi:hypothetical protein
MAVAAPTPEGAATLSKRQSQLVDALRTNSEPQHRTGNNASV